MPVEVVCDNCGRIFHIPLFRVKKNKHHFCSYSCYRKFGIADNIICESCGKASHRRPLQITKWKHHFCNKQCHGRWRSEHQKGENNPRWIDGKSKEEISETARFWRQLRMSRKGRAWIRTVLKRDKKTCQICSSKLTPCAHHIKSFTKYPESRFDVDNGITLCKECHTYVHCVDVLGFQ